MAATKTRTYLEMTSPAELIETQGQRVRTQRVSNVTESRDLYDKVRLELNWPTFEEWTSRAQDSSRHFFTLEHDSDVIGIGKLTDHGEGEVEIVSFGLLPEYRGMHLGGNSLVALTQAAWELSRHSSSAGRVWLHTSSRDHPNALSNYKSRGFRVFRVEERDVETRS